MYKIIFTESYDKRAGMFLKQHPELLKQYEKTLELLEQKHNKATEVFMDERLRGVTPPAAAQEDCEAWESSYLSLKKWEELEKEYGEVYRSLKI